MQYLKLLNMIGHLTRKQGIFVFLKRSNFGEFWGRANVNTRQMGIEYLK